MQTRGPTLWHRTREGWGNQLRGIARPDTCLPAASLGVVFRSVFFYRPYGARFLFAFAFPALKRWAILGRPFGALSSGLGCVRTAERRALPGFPCGGIEWVRPESKARSTSTSRTVVDASVVPTFRKGSERWGTHFCRGVKQQVPPLAVAFAPDFGRDDRVCGNVMSEHCGCGYLFFISLILEWGGL
jgi:hypothetical protein